MLSLHVPNSYAHSDFAQHWVPLNFGVALFRCAFIVQFGLRRSRFTAVALLPSGSPFWDPGSHGDLFQSLGPIRSPFSILGLKTREKLVQSPSYVDYLITCFNESHASLSVKVSSVLKNSLFQGITSFRSIFQIYDFLGPHFGCRGSQ